MLLYQIMAPKQEIWPVEKHVGETLSDLISRFTFDHPEFLGESITYAGRLDPMAEGIVILLVGDAVHKKESFLDLSKEYVFEVLWGLETDTYDSLGKIESIRTTKKLDQNFIRDSAERFVGTRTQAYPPYSSKPIDGKPLFQWAREGRIQEVDIPNREVEIYSLDIISHDEISPTALLKKIQENILKVHGDFRQEEILSIWQENMKLIEQDFFVTTMKAVVSSGTYVRSLCYEMGKVAGGGAIALSIKRTRVGEFSAGSVPKIHVAT